MPRLVDELNKFPELPLKPFNDGPEVMRHIEVNLRRARQQWLEETPPDDVDSEVT